MTDGHDHILKFGVMGSASGPQIMDPVAIKKARELGKALAKHECIFINGACPGLPHEALLAYKEEGGKLSIGISPAFSFHEHVEEYVSPHDNDVMLYTGQGFMERDIINIRSSDAIILIGGGIGTLNEFTIAYEEGRPIGVVTNSGGMSNHVKFIVEEVCKRKMAPNIVMDDDPEQVILKLEQVLHKFPLPIHEDGRVIDKKECRRGDWWCHEEGAAG